MKALSLHQPWASLVAVGVKTLETRSWSTDYRGPLAIHATKRAPEKRGLRLGDWLCRPSNSSGYELLAPGTHNGFEWQELLPAPYDLSLGAVVATCELVDVISTTGGWWCDPAQWANSDADTEHIRDLGWGRDGGGYWFASGQRPFGDFTPGRFAWLLDNITPLPEPVPARGRQRLWEWTP